MMFNSRSLGGCNLRVVTTTFGGPTVRRIAVVAVLAAAVSNAEAQPVDTIFADVGSPAVDGRVFKPHAARVRIYRGDTLVAQWTNELVLADSAGRRIMRWVTTSEAVPAIPNRPLSV